MVNASLLDVFSCVMTVYGTSNVLFKKRGVDSSELPGVPCSVESSALLLRVHISVEIQITVDIVLAASIEPLAIILRI